jgi:hypothetical protein
MAVNDGTQYLASIEATVFDAVWNGWTPVVQHAEHTHDIWYSNDQAFIDEISDFSLSDNYVMRWRGQITIAQSGSYQFQTESDDGSMLYIDSRLVVSNDGDHGRQQRQGSVTLATGLHDIIISFYEHSGGAALEVSWTPTPDASLVPLSGDVLSNGVGCAGGASSVACEATMYQHGGYQGWSAHFAAGDYQLAQFLAAGAIDNDGSSIVITGDDSCVVTVWENGDFSGWSRDLRPGSYDCCSSFPNDQPSSIQVTGSPSVSTGNDAGIATAMFTNVVPLLVGGNCQGTSASNFSTDPNDGPRVCGAVSQSTIGWSGEPDRAIDGNHDTNYGGSSCSHTGDVDGQTWFQVNLGSYSTVDRVAIYHRTDCCQDRLESALIYVSSTPNYNSGESMVMGLISQSRVWPSDCLNNAQMFQV